MKKTFKQLQEIDSVVGELYNKDQALRQTKFGYVYKRFCDKFYIPAIKNFNEEINNVRIDHALEDPITKEVISDQTAPRGFKYSKEGLKGVMAAEKNITIAWETKEIEVEPFISVYIPQDLTPEQTEILTGVLI